MAKARTWRRYRGWIAAGVLVVIAAAAFFAFTQSKAATPTETYQTEQVSIGTLSVTVSGTGNLAVDGTTDVYPDTAGTVASIAVAEGTAVSTGTVLFRLDAADAEAKTASALSSYRRAQQSVAQAEAQLVKAENTLTDLENRYASQSTAAVTTVASSAATSAGGTTAGTTATQVTTVSSGDIEVAEADVASAEASLAAAKADQTSTSLAYEDAQAAEDDLAVTSPAAGIVYSLDVAVGDSVSTNSGSSATSGNTGAAAAGGTGASTTSSTSSSAPVVIAPTQPLALVLAINEVDLPSLEVGQRADIEFDALPDLTATGKVIEIADEGTVSSGVVTYDVTLSLDVADPALRAGMSSAATIVTAIAKDAILVSNAAVKSNTDGTSYVLVMENGATTPTQVTVETGLSSSTQTQIISGLTEGQTVVTQTSTASSSGSDSDTESGGGFMMPGAGGGPGGPQ